MTRIPIAQILWGGWELWGLLTWAAGGVLSNAISFIILPFAQALPIWLKVLYGIGLVAAALIVSVIIIRILQAILKPQTDTGVSQTVTESQVPGSVKQQVAGRDFIIVNQLYNGCVHRTGDKVIKDGVEVIDPELDGEGNPINRDVDGNPELT